MRSGLTRERTTAEFARPRDDRPRGDGETHASLIGHRSLLGPYPPLDRPAARLFLTSATLLFVELLLIRWVPANVIYVGFFSNFLLMGSFLGIGVGILLGSRGRPRWLPPFGLLLFAIVALTYASAVNLQNLTVYELFVGLSAERSLEPNVLVLPFVVALTAVAMGALALPLGPLLRSMPPLRAYAIDIGGSLAGIAAFASLAALGTPPAAWFALVGALGVALALGTGLVPRPTVGAVGIACAVAVVLVSDVRSGDRWSPYYRVSVGGEEIVGVAVNGIPHQTLWPTAITEGTFYDQPYRWFPERTFRRALIVGAGGGTDVALALRRGVERIDAVEIDPVLLALGERHPDAPYADPRVRRHLDDGRAFLRGSDARYDLVVFAQADSLTLVTKTANLRLESFLLTEEAFASVREHLTPDGVFVLYYYHQPWLVSRFARMLEDVFGAPTLVHWYTAPGGGTAAIVGAGPGIAALGERAPAEDRASRAELPTPPPPATDDWPFVYLRERGIAPNYLVALGLVLLFALGAVAVATRGAGRGLARFSPHFFALGAAFLLLETKSLVTFSLLFGTTWLVNALVFFAVLCSVLAAIAVNARFRIRRPAWLYVGLFAALALGSLAPPASLLLDPPWLRYAVASLLAFTPVFFANLVFAHSFRDTRAADLAFASNLVGAMVGGLLEWAALATGFAALALLVATLYAAAFLLAGPWRLFADRALAPRFAPHEGAPAE